MLQVLKIVSRVSGWLQPPMVYSRHSRINILHVVCMYLYFHIIIIIQTCRQTRRPFTVEKWPSDFWGLITINNVAIFLQVVIVAQRASSHRLVRLFLLPPISNDDWLPTAGTFSAQHGSCLSLTEGNGTGGLT